MPAIISSETISVADKFLSKVAGGATLFLVPGKKGISLVSANKGNVASFRVPCEVFIDAPMEIDRNSLVSAAKGRKDLKWSVEAGTLKLQSKGYETELAVSEAPSTPSLQKDAEDASSIVLTQEIWEWVVDAIDKLRIDKTASTVDISLYVRVTEKGSFAVAYDMNHMAFMFNKALKGSLEFMLPFDVAQMIVKELPVIGTEISLSKAAATFRSKELTVQIALNAEVADNSLDPSTVYQKCLEVPKSEGKAVSFDRASLETFVANGAALPESTTSIVSFTVKDKGAVAEVKSASGKVKASIKGDSDSPLRFALSFMFLQQLLGKSKEEQVSITVVPEAFVLVKSAGYYYVAGLVSEETGG